MYRVFVQLDDCEFVIVACRDDLEETVQLIEGLNTYWPREYVVRDSEGNDVDLTKHTTIEHERGPASPDHNKRDLAHKEA
jgi:hypothetical protein